MQGISYQVTQASLLIIKIQISAAIATAVFNVILSIYLVKIIGASGAVFWSVIAWFL